MRFTMVSTLVLALLAAAPGILATRVVAGVTKDGSMDCQVCLASAHLLEDLLCDPYATDFLVDVMQRRVCPDLPMTTEKCTNLAEGLIPVLVQWFRSGTTPLQLCSSAGMCMPDALATLSLPAARVNKVVQPVQDESACAMCTFVVTQTQQLLNSSDVMQQLNSTAQQVCLTLPPAFSTACAGFVNQYEPILAQFITTVDAKELCQLMGVCMKAGLASMHARIPAATASAASKVALQVGAALAQPVQAMQLAQRAQLLAAAVQGPALSAPPPLRDQCDNCKMAVIEAHSLISSPAVQASAINYTKALCDSFPTYAEMCKTYVDEYAAMVFTLLEQYLVPDTVCAELGMCKPPPTTLSSLAASLLDWARDAGLLPSRSASAVAAKYSESNSVFRAWAEDQKA